MAIDIKDRKIIDLLKADGRMPIREIAKKTGMRPSTVHQRISKLRKDGVIENFTIKLNNKKAETNFIVFMFVKTRGHIDDKFFLHNSVKEAFGVTGQYDLVLKLKFKDIEEFNLFLNETRKNPHIVDTLTMVSTNNIKEEI